MVCCYSKQVDIGSIIMFELQITVGTNVERE